MTLDELLAEERSLMLDHFDAALAWRLGQSIGDELVRADARGAIDISRAGRTIFFAATDGATADQTEWIRRKRATVLRFERSSLAVAAAALEGGYDFHERYRLPREDFVAGAGGVPLRVEGAGLVGVATVSGLAGTEDHDLIVRHLRPLAGKRG